MKPFIDSKEIWDLIGSTVPTVDAVERVIAKSLSKQRLSMQEVALLVNTTDPALIQKIKEGARTLKQIVYGNRIVLFAPLYIGNKCQNNCSYCGFRVTNKDAERKTLNDQELINEIQALEDSGQKRLVLVFGEHKDYSPEFIAHAVKVAYSVKRDKGEIRRVNINAAPMEIEGFKVVKEAGIGTYQIFQETYHPEAYKMYHLGGKKASFENRLISLDKAQEAGLDDVGIGVLFGLLTGGTKYLPWCDIQAILKPVIMLDRIPYHSPESKTLPVWKWAQNILYRMRILQNWSLSSDWPCPIQA
ncbi:MAG: radical SAM protein [Flavobacteriaceae bacterium]|nr:radical SAM protein [Flavobacteriaceae bacterium]